MKKLSRTFAFLLMAGSAHVAAQGPVVRLSDGHVEGVQSGDVVVFKGIPYAAPPTGVLRWRAPHPVQPWNGIRSGAATGRDCTQAPEPGDAAAPVGPTSENCLVLNIWRPATAPSTAKLPVLVWIHGGGYVFGGTSTPILDGSALARTGLVVVTFNYRLGRLGFFAHALLVAERAGAVGNFAYMDMIAALRWVRRNASALGGDSMQITLGGQSAGGDAVMHLLTSPVADGLFQRAIVMSGNGRDHLLGGHPLTGGVEGAPSADQIGGSFARSVGIADGADALDILRGLPAERINAGLTMASLLRPEKVLTYARGAIVDSAMVVTAPGDAMQRGKTMRIPILIGSTDADLPLIAPADKEDPLSHFGPYREQARQEYDPDGKRSARHLGLVIARDLTMAEPARFVARRMSELGRPAWLYRFEHVPAGQHPEQHGAVHSSDVPYVFGTLEARWGTQLSDADRQMSDVMLNYFANFAKHGNPNGPGLPNWRKADPNSTELMMFTRDRGPLMQVDPWTARLDLIAAVADAHRKASQVRPSRIQPTR